MPLSCVWGLMTEVRFFSDSASSLTGADGPACPKRILLLSLSEFSMSNSRTSLTARVLACLRSRSAVPWFVGSTVSASYSMAMGRIGHKTTTGAGVCSSCEAMYPCTAFASSLFATNTRSFTSISLLSLPLSPERNMGLLPPPILSRRTMRIICSLGTFEEACCSRSRTRGGVFESRVPSPTTATKSATGKNADSMGARAECESFSLHVTASDTLSFALS
mmetsp:Transcript_95769/g.154470  ORF Transcript_95769/g.154470 Transcript_95769/m.154470 type:complete len:220 (-) Transcript_95769:1294-1953(-)